MGRDELINSVLGYLATNFEFLVRDITIFSGGTASAAVNMTLELTSRRTKTTIAMPYVEIYDVRDGRILRIDVHPQDTRTPSDPPDRRPPI